MEFQIANKTIGNGHPVFFIAEAGVNHNGSIDLAKELIDIAVEAEVDAVKFQTFKAEEMITKDAPKADYHIQTTGHDKQQTWYDLLKNQEISFEMHEELISYCETKEIIFMSTPYSLQGVDLLNDLGTPAFKVSSSDINNFPLLEHITKIGKPIIISTGASELEEVQSAVELFRKNQFQDFVLLQCTSNYPTVLEDSNLSVMQSYRSKFGCLYGYSDHTDSLVNPIAATALGSCVFEKHFTTDKKLPGPDHRMSMDPEELKQNVAAVRNTEKALGNPEKYVLPGEVEVRGKIRKSIVASRKIFAGETIAMEMLAFKRPGDGIPPSQIEMLLGKKATHDMPADYQLRTEILTENF